VTLFFRSQYGRGATWPLTEMSTSLVSWGYAWSVLRLTSLPPLCCVFMESGNLKFLEKSGSLQGSNGTALLLSLRDYLLSQFNFGYVFSCLKPCENFMLEQIVPFECGN